MIAATSAIARNFTKHFDAILKKKNKRAVHQIKAITCIDGIKTETNPYEGSNRHNT